jgi:uncharacterized protein (DUF1501 family)
MKDFLQTRREFLSTGIKGLSLLAASSYVPAFLTQTANAATAQKDSTILVVVQLSGGNDGLNTVVPFSDDLYHKARPSIALTGPELLKLNDHLALHPDMKPLKGEFDEGHMAIIQNVGYPNPNRSHFRSMEIWHTGNNEKSEPTGWLGRYFDATCSGADPHQRSDEAEIGISFGKTMPQSFRNRSNVALAIDNPETFQWNASGETVGLAKAQQAIFAKLNQPGTMSSQSMSMEALGGITGNEPETLDFLKHTAMNAVAAGDKVRAALSKNKSKTSFPDSQLGHELAMVSKLIAANFPTRVYYATQGGFDTHANQLATHSRLLGDLSDSVQAFVSEMRAQKNADRVLVLAFSEFGRRVAENGSAGTDHGAAAPMFLFGSKLKGGIHGDSPDLANLLDGDVRHKIDFRQVYASVLDRWLGIPSSKVLQGKFEPLGVLA